MQFELPKKLHLAHVGFHGDCIFHPFQPVFALGDKMEGDAANHVHQW